VFVNIISSVIMWISAFKGNIFTPAMSIQMSKVV
jgi:hypothetical protein